MSLPPGGRAPWWWHSCPWRATEGLPRAATNRGIFQSSLSLCLLVNAPMLHWACSTIIVNPNIKVKFQTNEHLKKVFSEQFELFWTKSRQVDLKHQLPSTFIKFMVTIKNYQNTKSNEKVCGCLLSMIFKKPPPEYIFQPSCSPEIRAAFFFFISLRWYTCVPPLPCAGDIIST